MKRSSSSVSIASLGEAAWLYLQEICIKDTVFETKLPQSKSSVHDQSNIAV